MTGYDVDTPSGPARVLITPAAGKSSRAGTPKLLVLGHGAGGGLDAPDLAAVTAAAAAAGWTVAGVEQPYRVARRRAPAPAAQLDAAWTVVLDDLRSRGFAGLAAAGVVVTGGRSSGARVACRTAAVTGVDGVVALAFPLRPPWRPERPRAGELAAVGVPLLVVQGDHDPFGGPGEMPHGPDVVSVNGDHSLRRAADVVAEAVVAWLAGIGPPAEAFSPT